MSDDPNQTNTQNPAQADDPFAPLTPDEQAQASVIALRQRVEVLNQMQAEYLEFLEDTKKLLQSLGRDEQAVKTELAKLAAVKKLEG